MPDRFVGLSVGSYMKVNASQSVAVPAGQPVDLTYAAEKALPAVVHIRFVQNSKTQTVEVQSSPFDDFFDPFGFFGNPNQEARRSAKSRLQRRRAAARA